MVKFKSGKVIKSTKHDFFKVIKYYPKEEDCNYSTILYVDDNSPYANQHFEFLRDEEKFIKKNGLEFNKSFRDKPICKVCNSPITYNDDLKIHDTCSETKSCNTCKKEINNGKGVYLCYHLTMTIFCNKCCEECIAYRDELVAINRKWLLENEEPKKEPMQYKLF